MSEAKPPKPVKPSEPTPAEVEMDELSKRHRALRNQRAAINAELAKVDALYSAACAVVALEKKRAKFELSLTPAERAAMAG